MYLSAGRAADTAAGVRRTRPRPPRGTGARRAVAGNVIALGAVSLVTDVSAEMVTAVLPLYLVVGLGVSPLAFGALDGLYQGASALSRLVGGHVADRAQRRKLVAGTGYALSAGCKLALLAATTPWAVGAVLAADHTGKGLRTAPRDALISLSCPPEEQGRAFGVHRAMDTAGALLGPLAAFAVLWAPATAMTPFSWSASARPHSAYCCSYSSCGTPPTEGRPRARTEEGALRRRGGQMPREARGEHMGHGKHMARGRHMGHCVRSPVPPACHGCV